MRLVQVGLRHFRNLAIQNLEIPPEGLALIGENGQGKSNFLEALYYLEAFRSFRGAPDEQLVAAGEQAFRVSTVLEGVGKRRVSAAYQPRGKRKKVTVDGAEPVRLRDALGAIGAVIFSPTDVALVSGGPAERRRYLDIVLSLNVPGYVRTLQRYRHVLRQRNAVLKDVGRRGGAIAALIASGRLRPWDEGLARLGARLVIERRAWVEEHCDAFRSLYQAVAADGHTAKLRYAPGLPLADASKTEDVEAAFRDALVRTAKGDRGPVSTDVGPHRDDLDMTFRGVAGQLAVRAFASGGQRRTAALALRLLEARTVRDRRGCSPLMLVDDVFAELDEGRAERALDLLEHEDTAQVILTAPRETDVRLKRDVLPQWRITAGRIQA